MPFSGVTNAMPETPINGRVPLTLDPPALSGF